MFLIIWSVFFFGLGFTTAILMVWSRLKRLDLFEDFVKELPDD